MSRKKRQRQQAAPGDPPPIDRASAFPVDWSWGESCDRYEAALQGYVIIWTWIGPKDLGGSANQTVIEFLAFGPRDKGAPQHVIDELRDTIRMRDPDLWSQLLADAEALRQGHENGIAEKKRQIDEAERAAAERFRETQSWPDPWRRYEPHRDHPRTRMADAAEPSDRFAPDQRYWSWVGGMAEQFSATLKDDTIEWQLEWPKQRPIEQPIVEFLAFGSPGNMAPPLVVSDLREVIRARDVVRWHELLAAAEALRWKRTTEAGNRSEEATPETDYTRRSASVWEWGEPSDGYTALVSDDEISWNWHGPKDLGNTIGQSIVDFIAYGPAEETAPSRLARDIFDTIRKRDAARWPRLLAAARALRKKNQRQTMAEPQDRKSYQRSSPSRDSWEWRDKYNRYAAWLTENGIYWSWEGEKDLGGSSEQTYAEFLSNGPRDRDVPEQLLREIQQAVAARRGNGGSPPPPGSTRALADDPDPGVDAGDYGPPEPLPALLGRGLLVFGVSVGAALLLAPVLPTLAKFVSIILPVLAGFAAAFRWGSLGLIVAGFFAMAAGFGSQFAYERYAELASGPVATLGSIAEVPRHPDATRFLVADARPAPAFAGNARRTIYQRVGAGPSPQVWSLQVMPLVPGGWTRDQPVPAWMACTTTPGFDCLRRMGSDMSRTIRVREAEVAYYREAIADARRRHGLTSAAAAPLLEPASDPIGLPEFYLAGMVAIPVLVFVLWAVSIMGWRLWRRRSRGAATTT